MSVNGTTVVVEMDPVAGATKTRLQGRLDGAAEWASYGRTDGFRFSKGGLAAGSHELRLTPLDGADKPVGEPASSVRVVIAAPVAQPTPTPTPTPGGTRAMRDASSLVGDLAPLALPRLRADQPVMVPTLPAALTVFSETASENAPVMVGHPFGPGDVPRGHRVRLRTAAGMEVPVQCDGETRFPDGSLKFAVLSFYAPGRMAAGEESALVVDSVAGEADRTPHTTPAALASLHDYRLAASGGTWGGDRAVLRVRDAVAAVAADAAAENAPYRVETRAAGPLRCQWLIRGVARRERDGALHESVELCLYVTAWSDGTRTFYGRQRQPSYQGPFAGAAWKTTGWNQANVGAVECRDGDRLLWVRGGPNDPNARTVDPAAFDPQANTYRIPRGQNLGQASGIGDPDRGGWHGMGVPFGVAGNIPPGMAADKPYWLGHVNLYTPESQAGRIFTRRNDTSDAAAVDLTAAPAGPVRVFPLVQSHPGGGANLADERGEAFWVGEGERPRVYAGHDFEYLTRSTRLLAPMDLSCPAPDEPPGHDSALWEFHPYMPNQVYRTVLWDPGMYGDDWHTDRIGWASRQFANWVRTYRDRRRRTHCLALAHSQADIQWDFEDSRSGRVPVVNNGPDGKGGRYPGLPAPTPGLFMTYRDGQGPASADPGFHALAHYNRGGSGYTPRYDPINDGSHFPAWQRTAYLMTGEPIFLDILRTNVGTLWASCHGGKRQRKLAPPMRAEAKQYYGLFWDQYRANGWARLALSDLNYMLPDNHPERPYFRDLARDNEEYFGAIAQHSPWKLFGVVPLGPPDGLKSSYTSEGCRWDSGINAGFQNVFEAMGTAMCLYRGESGWRPWLDVTLGFLRDACDDKQSPNGSGFFTGIYFADFATAEGKVLYDTRRGWIEGSSAAQAGTKAPFPPDRNWAGNHWDWNDPKADQSPSGYLTSYDGPQMAVLALADWLGFPDCARVRLQVLDRVMAHPDDKPKVRDRMIFGSEKHPGQLGLQWSVLPRGL